MKNRKELNEEDFYNWWLKKYHNTTISDIIEKEPELCQTAEWYKKYAVTQKQHDEWYAWAIDTIAKRHKISRKFAKRRFVWNYLNVAPSIS